jgi:purine-nucleoside phosphorylase
VSEARTLIGRLDEAVAAIRDRSALSPLVALVLGSGLGRLAHEVENPHVIPYREIPHFPLSTAPSHAGRLVLGTLEGKPVAVMAGRVHMYEGYSAPEVVFPVQTLRRLGAETLIVTNAAGGVNLEYEAGTLMVISDHINLTGRNPLVGVSEPALGTRFPDMTDAYSPALRSLASRVAAEMEEPLPEGVYLGLLGPSYETPAEIRMARSLGADAVGMSTVVEVIAARHAGMEVLGISCITNMAAGILPTPLSEEEVIETAERVSSRFATLLRGIVAALPERSGSGE